MLAARFPLQPQGRRFLAVLLLVACGGKEGSDDGPITTSGATLGTAAETSGTVGGTETDGGADGGSLPTTGSSGGVTGDDGADASGGTTGAADDGPMPGEPCGEGWGGELIPGSVDLGLASNPEIEGIASGQADERTVFDQINGERMANGLTPLIWSDQVANVARSHAADMEQLGYFDHGSSTRPYEGNQANWLPFPRLDFVYPGDFDRAGENIARGYGVSMVVPAWMDSPGHRAAILDEYGWTSTHGAVGIHGSSYVFNPATCAQ